MSRRIPTVLALALLTAYAAHADAQALGTFRWQLQPFCNVVTLNIVGQGATFTLDGFDDQCGAGQRASVVGTAFPNPDGTIGIGLNTVLAPGGAFVHVEARISLASLSGPWHDSARNSGTFVFTPGPGSGGAARPVGTNGVAPGSITTGQLAPGAVGMGQINPSQVQTRIGGTCPVGQYLRGINENGTVVCEPVPVTTTAAAEGKGSAHFSTAWTSIVSLSANGAGPMVIPSRARVVVQGSVGITRMGTDPGYDSVAACVLLFGSKEVEEIGGRRISLSPLDNQALTLTGAVDVVPGSYDLRMECQSQNNLWSYPTITAIAVPR